MAINSMDLARCWPTPSIPARGVAEMPISMRTRPGTSMAEPMTAAVGAVHQIWWSPCHIIALRSWRLLIALAGNSVFWRCHLVCGIFGLHSGKLECTEHLMIFNSDGLNTFWFYNFKKFPIILYYISLSLNNILLGLLKFFSDEIWIGQSNFFKKRAKFQKLNFHSQGMNDISYLKQKNCHLILKWTYKIQGKYISKWSLLS